MNNFKKKIKNIKGFTLIEVLVTALISTIVLTGVGMFLTQSVAFSDDINMNSQVHAAMSLASRIISEDVKMCEGFVAETAGSDNIELLQGNNVIKYYFEGNMLKRKEWLESGAEPLAGDEVIKFADVDFTGLFFNDGNYNVRIDFNVTINYNHKSSSTGTHTFYTKQRNKVRY